MNSDLLAGILLKVEFKGDEFRRYKAAAVYAALHLYPAPFAADDVPEAFRPDPKTTESGRTTPGCAFATLRSDAVHVFRCCGRRTSRSRRRNGARINEYTVDWNRAVQWLTANGFPLPDSAKDVSLGQLLLGN